MNTLGGGPGSFNRNDQRIALDAIHFLKKIDSSRPFALIVSLVNPHDVWVNAYSALMAQAFPEFPAAFDALEGADCFQLPPSYLLDDLSTKPGVQRTIRHAYTTMWAKGNSVSPVPSQLNSTEALTYLKFYAYLTYLADQQLNSGWRASQSPKGWKNTWPMADSHRRSRGTLSARPSGPTRAGSRRLPVKAWGMPQTRP